MQKATVGNNKSTTSQSRMSKNIIIARYELKPYITTKTKILTIKCNRYVKFRFDSLKYFIEEETQIEIDHEIAKCLDTLDRQGLKYLKETLKTSNIFNSTNLEVDEKNESQQSLKSIKGGVKVFEPEVESKNRISQQESKKSLKKDFLQENKKSFLKNKEPKKELEPKYRSNSSARMKPSSLASLTEETKVPEKARPLESEKEKKRESAQNASSSRVNQKEQSANSRVIKKTVIQNKKTNEKISIGEKINKKMQELNIQRVGPGKNDKKGAKKHEQNLEVSISNEPEELIEEDIVESNDNEIEENYTENMSRAESESIIKSSIGYNYELTEPEIKISQKINPLKPSAKDKLIENETILSESKIEESQLPEGESDSKSFVEKLSASIQVDHEDLKLHQSDIGESYQSAKMSLIVEKINKLSPDKLVEIQKYLDFIENKSTNVEKEVFQIEEELKNPHKNVVENAEEVNLHNLPEVCSTNSFRKYEKDEDKIKGFQKSSSYNEDEIIANRNKLLPHVPKSESRKGIREKKEKASMIYGSGSMKSASRSRIKIDMDYECEEKPQEEKNIYKSENIKPYLTSRREGEAENDIAKKHILESEKPLKMEKINYNLTNNQSDMMKHSSIKEYVNEFNKPELKQYEEETINDFSSKENENVQKSLEIVENNLLNIESTEVKMLNISNKKLQITKKPIQKTQLKFKILSNRGHPSIFGLTGIELYTIENKRVVVTEKELSLNPISTSKLLYLFNGNHYTTQEENIFQSPLSKNEIIVELDKENEKIGGILIFNFNKSSLENSKEVDELEIYHNSDKMWKGTLNPGVYNEITDYATQIEFMPNFKFPKFEKTIKNDSLTINKEKPEIWIENKEKSELFSLPKEESKVENQEKIIYKSENRRNNASGFENEKNHVSINLSLKKIEPNQEYQKLEQPRPKDVNETKSRVQSVAFEHKPTFQKKTINTTRQENYDEFDTMLKGLEENINREKSKSKLPPPSISLENQYGSVQSKEKTENAQIKFSYQTSNPKKEEKPKAFNNEMDDFMNDSIFNDKPHSKIPSMKKKIAPPKKEEQNEEEHFTNYHKKDKDFTKKNNDVNIDDFLGELEDVMRNKESSTSKKVSKTDKKIEIPNLPKGEIVEIEILENWGHQAYVGLQAIEFFDEEGKILIPQSIDCNKNLSNVNLLQNLNNKNIANRDEKIQTKLGYDRSSSTVVTLRFSTNKIFSLIRVWNYNGHRVHSNIGIKECVIKIDGNEIFMGSLKKNESTPENFYKNFDTILLTNDQKIFKKIKENDWLTELKNKIKEEKNLFKSTLINFNRPKTKNSEQKTSEKENFQKEIQKITKEIKLPKRACWEYEPPEMPEGNILIFLLHETWGDQNFIGLNGIEIFDGTGNMLGKNEISKIKAYPSTTGEKNDKRIIENVLNGLNFTNSDFNIWLSTFQSDIEKLESGKPNTIIVELHKQTKISGVNFYNYSKTPERGVREVEIQINSLIAFRGYLKMFDSSSPQNMLHTTINFTKNIQLLEKMNYEGYNEDNIDQNVAFVNEKKNIKI